MSIHARLANALVFCRQWLAYAATAGPLSCKLAQQAPDGALSKLHVFAQLANTQALRFNHLSNLQLEVCAQILFEISGCSRFMPFRF